MLKDTHNRKDDKIFNEIVNNLEELGIPRPTRGRRKKGVDTDITDVLTGTVCNVGRHQVNRYISGRCSCHIDNVGDIFSTLREGVKFTNCPSETKQKILLTSGCVMHHNRSFTLDECKECFNCAYRKQCRKDNILYRDCPFVIFFCQLMDNHLEFEFNADTTIKEIRNRKVGLPYGIDKMVDCIYQYIGSFKTTVPISVDQLYMDTAFKYVHLLMRTSIDPWKFTVYSEETAKKILESCGQYHTKKTISQISDSRPLAMQLEQFSSDLGSLQIKPTEFQISDIATMESFHNLNFLEAIYVFKNILLLTYCRLRPVDVELYSTFSLYLTEEEQKTILAPYSVNNENSSCHPNQKAN